MNNNRQFDEHIKAQFDNYAPDVHPRIWENIIAQKDNYLAIVEVKTRSSLDFGDPQDFVKPKKIQLLIKAVNAYINDREMDFEDTIEVRFDIIAIHKNGETFAIEHLTDAFYHF